jgi:hypothetical protein
MGLRAGPLMWTSIGGCRANLTVFQSIMLKSNGLFLGKLKGFLPLAIHIKGPFGKLFHSPLCLSIDKFKGG